MAVSFENCLVIGISSRALFDLTKENEIFEKRGWMRTVHIRSNMRMMC